MTDTQPITGEIIGDWPILDADTPIFNEVAVHLGLVTSPEPVAEESEQDTGEPAGGEHDDAT